MALNERQRDRMSADRFAFPKERKEPLNDARHVRNAVARFDQVEGVSNAERDRAWRRIRAAARKYDVEAWIPTQDAYRELTSTSNCTTYQARRLDIRYRTESGKTAPVATLNGTLATTRWIVALLETHQQADGSVLVPEALQPFLGLDVLRPARAL